MTQPNSLLDAFRDMLRAVSDADLLPTDPSIHGARRAVKRTRAALRLIRAGIGGVAYRKANTQLRDIARPLTPVRDGVALLDALETLCKPKDRKTLKRYEQQVHRALQDSHRLNRENLTEQSLRHAGERLRAVHLEVSRWSCNVADAKSARRGIETTYKRGREAFSKARKHGHVALLHEWRKQAKYLANEISLAEELGLLKLKKQRRGAQRVGELLGEDHDLALLHGKLRELAQAEIPGFGAERKWLARRIVQRRLRLQRKARRVGAKLFGDSPKNFDRAVRNRLQL
jgi:hypothetical protein